MKVNELRIGNYVNADLYNNDLILIESICSKNEEIFNSTTGEIPLTSIKPIPLTEEWLLKFGFDLKKGTKYFHKEFNRLYLDISNPIYKHLGNVNGNLKEVEYVHQLQNLYFALTNEELTIKQ